MLNANDFEWARGAVAHDPCPAIQVLLARRRAIVSGGAAAAGKAFLKLSKPRLPNSGGRLPSTGTMAELAGQPGLPAEALGAEVERHDAAVDAGTTGALQPTRGTHSLAAMPIRNAPFSGLRAAEHIALGVKQGRNS